MGKSNGVLFKEVSAFHRSGQVTYLNWGGL